MSREKSDYSKTIIYKIYCKDLNITDIYIGHTTKWKPRINSHKISCNKETDPDYNDKKYIFIRLNGGWDNWIMEQIEIFNFSSLKEARLKEQEYINLLKPSLNMDKSVRTKEEQLKYNKEWHEINKEEQYKKHNDKYKNDEEYKNKAIERAKKRQEQINNDSVKKEELKKYKAEWYQKNKLKNEKKLNANSI